MINISMTTHTVLKTGLAPGYVTTGPQSFDANGLAEERRSCNNDT